MREIDKEVTNSLFGVYPFVAAAYQFGSTVSGRESPLSDLDIAILVDERRAPPDLELLRTELVLAYEFQKRLAVSEVDLITLNHQRPSLQYTVLRTGKLIYEANREYRIHFTQRVLEAYLDFRPTLEMMDRFNTRGRLRRCQIR